MDILEKVAYMKGLAEGLGLDTKTKEGKLLTVMIDLLDDIDAGSKTAMTRNEVAQLALNALEATVVEETANGSNTSIKGEDFEITVDSSVIREELTTSKYDYNNSKEDSLQLIEKLYGNDFEKDTTGETKLGLPATVWYEEEDEEIVFVADEADDVVIAGKDTDTKALYLDKVDEDFDEDITEKAVKAGDVVQIIINTYDPSAWSTPAGTITFTAAFEKPVEIPTGTVRMANLALELESVIFMNFKCVVTGFEGYDQASNMGLIMWTGDAEYSEELFVVGNENVTDMRGATLDAEGRWVVQTPGIAAKEMGNEYYIRAYVALPDGTYIYSTKNGETQIQYHGVQKYALGRLGKDGENFDKVIVALMDYAAAAQVQFGYKLDDLANDIDVTELTTELGFEAARAEEILAAFAANKTEYSADMVIPTVTPDSTVLGSWIRDTAAKNKVGVNASLTLEGIITNNYKFALKASGTVAQAKFLYWTTETYEALLAKGEAFSEANATEVIIMEIGEDGRYVGEYDKTAAKEMGNTIYVCGLIETTDGTVYNSGIVTHSAHAFLSGQIAKDSMVTLAKALIVYGDAAETYFENR